MTRRDANLFVIFLFRARSLILIILIILIIIIIFPHGFSSFRFAFVFWGSEVWGPRLYFASEKERNARQSLESCIMIAEIAKTYGSFEVSAALLDMVDAS